jgi:hypothetical protein
MPGDAFDPATGAFLGQLRATNGQVLKIDDLRKTAHAH